MTRKPPSWPGSRVRDCGSGAGGRILAAWSMSLHQDRGWVHDRPRESSRLAREIERYGPIIAAAEKETPLLRHTFETIRM